MSGQQAKGPQPPQGKRAPSATTGSGRRVTILDVAERAGVSVSAVSKVVRGAYGVSQQMQTRVTSAIEELGYRPHAGARTMRGRSYTVGVVLAELTSPFPMEVAKGVSDALQDTPFQDLIVPGGLTPERQTHSIEALLDRQVDGLVLVAPWLDAHAIEKFAKVVPTVTIALHGSPVGFDTVVDDERLGARLMVDYLVANGHRRIVHTSMPSAAWEKQFVLSHTARRQGFAQAMRSHGLEPDIIETWYSEEGGHDAAFEALSRPKPPTAIFAGADISALGVLRAAEERGLRVPGDLTVVGYDNIYASTINRVSLTTVDQSGQHTGEAGVRLLMERIEGRTDPQTFVVAPKLVVRGTSGPPAKRTKRPSPHTTS